MIKSDIFLKKNVDSYLFGKYSPCHFIRESFEPFWNVIISSCEDRYNKDYFMEGSFSLWKESFLMSLSYLWLNAANSIDYDEDSIWNGSFYKEMCTKYPVFERQLDDFCARQTNHIIEIIEEIENELPSKYNLFFDKRMPKVKEVSPTESDRHNGGRSVHIITFEDDSKLVYKPHNMKIDIAFSKFSSFIAKKVGIGEYKLCNLIETKRGAFSEFYIHKELSSKNSASLFYKREGFLLALIYILRGNDMHMENIIADGDYPKIIDMETVISPIGTLITRIKDYNTKYTVNSTMFLPVFIDLPGFKNLEFDSISSTNIRNKNYPIFNNKHIDAFDYIDDVCEGFNIVYNYIINNKDEVKNEIYRCFSNCPVRLVLRTTSSYMLLLKLLGMPKCISDEMKYKETMKILVNADDFIFEEDRKHVIETEENAINILDVPYFTEVLDEKLIKSINTRIENLSIEDKNISINRVKFSLNKYYSNDKSENRYNILDSFNDVDASTLINTLNKFVINIFSNIENNITRVVSIPPDGRLMLTDSLYKSIGIFEGNLGIAISLSAYLTIVKDDYIVKKVLDELINLFNDKLNIASAISPEYMGIPDGASGLLIGTTILLEMNVIDETIYKKIISKIGELKEIKGRIKLDLSRGIYNNLCFLCALDRMDRRFISKELKEIEDTILSLINEDKTLKNFDRKKFYNEIKNSISNGDNICLDRFSENNTMLYGNAGTLYNYTLNYDNYDNKSLNFAKKLLEEKTMIKDLFVPTDVCELSFFTGFAGMLYSVCRLLNRKIPKIL